MSYRMRGPYTFFLDTVVWCVAITGGIMVSGSVLWTLYTLVQMVR